MNGKRFFDIMICGLAAAVMILGYLYIDRTDVRRIVLGAGAVVFLFFLFLAVRDNGRTPEKNKRRKGFAGKKGVFYALALLDEDDKEISQWNIAGKISLIIGRSTRKEDVDVNLMNTEFAGMVDRQHAVLNYAAGRWYIEDLDSANGIRIRKKKDGKIYEISKTQPCAIEKGDVLYIGLTKLEAK